MGNYINMRKDIVLSGLLLTTALRDRQAPLGLIRSALLYLPYQSWTLIANWVHTLVGCTPSVVYMKSFWDQSCFHCRSLLSHRITLRKILRSTSA